MSWAQDNWTVGLSGRVLQKVNELQVHQERLSRENKQKQLQLDNIRTSLEKQTVKYDEVCGELQCLQRELQGVREEARVAVTTNGRLTQELQTKQSQVCSLEGQLDAARTLNNKLSQEVKRLETELEKLQKSSRSADTTLFSTPCWNNTSPWEHNESRMEERSGHRDEGEGQALHIRRLQFSEVGSASAPRKQHKNTPHRHTSNQSDIFSTPLAVFPWERDDSRPAARRLSPNSPQTPSSVSRKEKDHRTETDSASLSEASRVTGLEEELCAKATMLKSLQGQIVQTQKELRTKELSLQKACDELNLAHARIAQESERTSGAEQRLKHLQEELKCQRQNAESSRLQHQQRTKELEKQHQRDLAEFQKERQCLEKQHQQEVNKLNQELQQARTLHNALQAQADKLSLQKQALGKECDIVKEKLKCTEVQLQESQKKEAQTQAKLMEALHEVEGVALSLDQSRMRERALEEEGRRLTEELAGALRLIEQLQEQRAVPITPLQPVLFGTVGQSFSPQPSYSFHSHTSTHIKKPSVTTLAQQREENVDVHKRRAEIVASYPSGKEPKEGIDTEHLTELLSPDSKCLQRGGHRSNEEDNTTRTEAIKSDSSGTNKRTTFDQVFSSSSFSAADADQCTFKLSKASEELKRENAILRSELHDVREELQKRLDDLEVQRQAETEARNRQQLSRQHASQAMEKNEQDKEWRARLESERAETERLRKAMAALETEMKRREESERKEQEEDKSKVLEDRESEMTELNIQLKTQLAMVKAQLALEREERTREEVERNQKANTVVDVKKQLSMKVEELKAELEELKRSREDDSQEEEKVVDINSPLTYLTLHDEELNFNIICNNNKPFPSPEQPFHVCQSTNQQNMLVSQATADLIKEEQAMTDPESSPPSNEGHVATELEDDRQNYLGGSFQSGHILKVDPVSSDMRDIALTEIRRLQKENIKETERANQYQVKLEALQSQVICQTKHLTTAFEKQRQHISGLLAELQDKESALLIQGEELQCYKQELDALKTKKEGGEMMNEEGDDHGEQTEAMPNQMPMGISRLNLNQKNKCPVMLTTESLPDGDSTAQRDEGQLEFVTPDAERPKSICEKSGSEDLWSDEQHPGSQATTLNIHSSSVMGETEVSQDGRTADVAAELFILQQENPLLKQTKECLTVSASRIPPLHKNTGNAALPCLDVQKLTRVLNDITDAQMEEGRTAKTEELQVDSLQQQVEKLQRKLQALSAEKQQQDEELVMWRLVSQPAPTFDQFFPSTDTQNQIAAVTPYQSNQQQTEETAQSQGQAPHLGVQGSPSNLTIVREDELLLSCSSKKLQGCILLSRLQHSNLPEHKSLHSSKKAAPLQEYNHTVQEAEKENHNILLLPQSEPRQIKHKEKRETEVIQISSEKTSQPQATKVSIPQHTKSTQCYAGSPETSRATNETNTLSYSSDSDVRTEMKSVSSQTEESLCTCRAQITSELHCAYTQTEGEDEDKFVESSFISPVPIPEGDKMLFSGSFPIPADPARLAERIRRNRTQLSAAFDDTEYEPYGLPEVVMKGFADIPSGPSCPYIVRRGLLGTTVVPQKDPRQEEETD